MDYNQNVTIPMSPWHLIATSIPVSLSFQKVRSLSIILSKPNWSSTNNQISYGKQSPTKNCKKGCKVGYDINQRNPTPIKITYRANWRYRASGIAQRTKYTTSLLSFPLKALPDKSTFKMLTKKWFAKAIFQKYPSSKFPSMIIHCHQDSQNKI